MWVIVDPDGRYCAASDAKLLFIPKGIAGEGEARDKWVKERVHMESFDIDVVDSKTLLNGDIYMDEKSFREDTRNERFEDCGV